MKQAFLPYLAAMLLTLLGSCSHSDDFAPWEQAVESFSVAYFNWDYPKAASYATDSSLPWLSYAGSQVTQDDLELINTKTELATVEVMPDAVIVNDSCVVATGLVRNFLEMDSIDDIVEVARKNFPGRIDRHCTYLYGICAECMDTSEEAS